MAKSTAQRSGRSSRWLRGRPTYAACTAVLCAMTLTSFSSGTPVAETAAEEIRARLDALEQAAREGDLAAILDAEGSDYAT